MVALNRELHRARAGRYGPQSFPEHCRRDPSRPPATIAELPGGQKAQNVLRMEPLGRSWLKEKQEPLMSFGALDTEVEGRSERQPRQYRVRGHSRHCLPPATQAGAAVAEGRRGSTEQQVPVRHGRPRALKHEPPFRAHTEEATKKDTQDLRASGRHLRKNQRGGPQSQSHGRPQSRTSGAMHTGIPSCCHHTELKGRNPGSQQTWGEGSLKPQSQAEL